MTDKEKFGGKCPYNNEPCKTFNCKDCDIEHLERKYMEQLDEEESVDRLAQLYSNENIYKELHNTQELLFSVSAKVIDIHTRIQYIEKLLDRGKEE